MTAKKQLTPLEFVKIYMLTPLTEEEEKHFLEQINPTSVDGDTDYDSTVQWIVPQLVHWTSQKDGSVEQDLLPLFKKHCNDTGNKAGEQVWLADRQSVDEGSTIVAHRDWYSMGISTDAGEFYSKLAAEHGIEISASD